MLPALARQALHHRLSGPHVEAHRRGDGLSGRTDEDGEARTRQQNLAHAVADGHRAVAVHDDRATVEVRRHAGDRVGAVLDVADRADAAADANRHHRRRHRRAAVVADVAADEAQDAFAQRRLHRAARAGVVDELIDHEVAVLADAERAAIEEGELGGAAALRRDPVVEEDVVAGRQRPRGPPRRAAARCRVGRPHGADDLLGESRPGHRREGEKRGGQEEAGGDGGHQKRTVGPERTEKLCRR